MTQMTQNRQQRIHSTAGKRPARLPSARALSTGIAFLFFGALCLLPSLYMFVVSLFGADGGLSFENYRRLLAEPRQRGLLLTSALLGAGTAVLATTIGAPLGLLLARSDLGAKRFWRLALVVPLVVPPYILGLAWVYIGGSAGLVAQIFGRDLLSNTTYSLTGAIVVLGLAFFPLSMLATEAAARRVDNHLEEAALLVAGWHRVLWRITFPLIAPSIAAAALITFVLAISEFGVPSLLRVPVFTTEVFTAFSALYDFGAATALAVPLLVLALVAAAAVKLIIGNRMLTERRSARTGLPLLLGRLRIPVMISLAAVLFLSAVLPVLVLSLEAGRVEQVTAAVNASRGAITNSLALSAVGATLIVALSVLLGYERARARFGGRGWLDFLFVATFAVPSTVVGVGLINLWNRPGPAGDVYQSVVIIVIAYVARFVPVSALMLAASVRQVPASFEEAAEVAGATWQRTFVRIVLPNIRPGLAAAWVVAFILAFGELGSTILVSPPGDSTVPVRIYTLIANTTSSEISALALMQIGIVLIPLALLGLVGGRKGIH